MKRKSNRYNSSIYIKLTISFYITTLLCFSTSTHSASIITTNDGIWTSVIGFEAMPHTGISGPPTALERITGEEYAAQGVHFSSNYIAYNLPGPSGNDSIDWMGITGAHIGEAYGTNPITNTPDEMWISFDYLVNKVGFNWRSNTDVSFSIYNNNILLDTFNVTAPGISQEPTPLSFVGFTDDVFNKVVFNIPDGYGMNLDNLSIQAVPIPPSLLLLASGFISLMGFAGRKKTV